MATVAELKAAKREDLDKLAVEQGLDPAQYSKVDELRAELLKSAEDAEGNDDAGNTEEQEGEKLGQSEQQTTTQSVERTVANDADKAAAAAEEPTVSREATTVLGHADSFDKDGQPVFYKPAKKGRK